MGHGFGSHHARHYHSMGSHHFGRNICNCLCCFFCVGPILFLVGFGMLVSSLTDYRTVHIENYNSAVELWSSGETVLSSYENTRLVSNVSMAFDNMPLTSSKLPNTSTPETYIFDDDLRVETYTQFVRFGSGSLMDFSGHCSQYNPWYGCDVTPLASFSLFVNGKNIYHASVPAFTRTRKYTPRESDCADGDFWDSISLNCDAYSVISTICVKIEQTATNWAVDYSYGGIGCGQNAWEAASYTRLRLYSTADFPRIVSVPLSVRSSRDPRVAFYNEMGIGATSFGMTQGAKARTGAVLLIIGSVILFFLCGAACKLARLDKHHRYYEEVRAPGMVVAQPAVVYQQPAVVYAAPPAYPPQYQQPGYQQPGYQQPGYQQPGYYQQPIPVAYSS